VGEEAAGEESGAGGVLEGGMGGCAGAAEEGGGHGAGRGGAGDAAGC